MLSHDWVLKRNCSVTPRQLWSAYVAICTASGLVALAFALRGAWYVLVFAFVELGAVGLAFLVFGRHATDRERVALAGDRLLIEVVVAERVQQTSFSARSARVDAPLGNGLVRIRCPDGAVEVGRFIAGAQRRQFARELDLALRHKGPTAQE